MSGLVFQIAVSGTAAPREPVEGSGDPCASLEFWSAACPSPRAAPPPWGARLGLGVGAGTPASSTATAGLFRQTPPSGGFFPAQPFGSLGAGGLPVSGCAPGAAPSCGQTPRPLLGVWGEPRAQLSGCVSSFFLSKTIFFSKPHAL